MGGARVAGIKFSLDGSPQGRTAWVTEPYVEGPPGAAPDYVAYGTMDPDRYKAGAAALIKAGIPFLAHANGDAAMDLMLDGVDEALADMDEIPDHRSVIIHAQLMRADQLDRAAELNVVPSFFSAHTFFWGDWHVRSFGEERGNNISPVRWAIDRGVPFTIHNDSPIVPPNIMRLVSITVNRKSRSGRVLGPHQRATVMEALNAVTLGAAYQFFEEDTKGSLTVGKQADLVILEMNPLTTDPAELEGIQILETFSRGRSVHKL
jgi:predicted amidohydrolase YtcJ